jgi:type II restriction enzyme
MNNNLQLFIQNITPDIIPVDRFVDWNSINEKINLLRREIALLESIDKSRPLEDLTDILLTNCNTLDVLKLLISHTPARVYFSDGRFIDFIEDKKKINTDDKKRAHEIAKMFKEIGLFAFLAEVKSVRDVVKGVLIGLQPNNRKSWRGMLFEERIKNTIEKVLVSVENSTGIKLSCEPQVNIDLKRGKKILDYMILKRNKPVAAIEVNFYSTSGSKPSEVLERAYPNLEKNLKDIKIPLIVITDGMGWLKMQKSIERSLRLLSHLMTIKQAESGGLEKILIDLIK